MGELGYELIHQCEYETLDELDKHLDPFIKGLVRDEGQTILITGGSKSGKSQLAIQLALALANGDEWLGFKMRPPVSTIDGEKVHDCILYLNLEIPPRTFRYRLKMIAKRLYGTVDENDDFWGRFCLSDINYSDIASLASYDDNVEYLIGEIKKEINNFNWTTEKIPRKDENGAPVFFQGKQQYDTKVVRTTILFSAIRGEDEKENIVDDYVSQPVRIATVIIDPVYKAFGGDENSVREVGRFLSRLHALNVNTILVHHHSKGSQSGKVSMDRGSGSGAFARDATAIIDMVELTPKEPPKDGARAFKFEFTTRDYRTPAPLYVWFRHPIFELAKPGELDGARAAQLSNHEKGAVAMENKKVSKMEEFERVFESMDSGSGVEVSTIAEKINVVDRTVLRYMGDINKRHGKKVYSQKKGIITKE